MTGETFGTDDEQAVVEMGKHSHGVLEDHLAGAQPALFLYFGQHRLKANFSIEETSILESPLVCKWLCEIHLFAAARTSSNNRRSNRYAATHAFKCVL
jgi:hypothetical protein